MAIKVHSPAVSVTNKASLPPGETDSETKQAIHRDWKNDREVQELAKLGYALGVGEIILANRDIDEDDEDFQGQYFYADSSDLEPWNLSPRQLATVNRALTGGRDVILINESGDFAPTLAHELGHYINNRLGGLTRPELFSRVTENMRRVARFREYFFQNKDEYYAETWGRFLRGKENRGLFRYLNRPLSRLRMKHPRETRLILEVAKRCAN